MRFVPAPCLQTGMICAQPIYGKNGELMLNKDAIIQTSYINKIEELGIAGVYIQDHLSEGIEFVDIISQAQRAESVRLVKNLFESTEDSKANVRQKIEKLNKTVEGIIDSVLTNKDLNFNLIDLKIFDDYTYFHCVNVGVLAILVGTRMQLHKQRLHELGMAAMLHDIGKIYIGRQIINKPDKLTDEEFTKMKKHSKIGHDYLQENYPGFSYNLLQTILEHHERIDGSGYPLQKRAHQICKFAKIITLVDVFDALTSDRPYRKAETPSNAIEYIMAQSNKSFDPVITKIFLSCVMPYSPGSTVRLSNGWIAIVVSNNFEASLRPKVRVIRQDKEQKTEEKDFIPFEIDLYKDPNLLDITVVGNIDSL